MEGETETPLEINGVEYFTSNQVARFCGVTRQTLWRWRGAGTVPKGRLYRDRIVVFTAQERDRILQYSHRLQSLDPLPDQADRPAERSV